MKLRSLTLTMLAALAAVGGLASEARAGGDEPDCLVTDKSLLKGRDKITGTAVVTLSDFQEATISASAVAATLTLKFQGDTAVFRANLGPVAGTSPEAILCDVIAAPAETGAGQTIVDAFGIPAGQQLVLCLVREEKAGTQGTAVTCQSVVGLDFAPVPGTTDWTGTADLNIFVIPVAP